MFKLFFIKKKINTSTYDLYHLIQNTIRFYIKYIIKTKYEKIILTKARTH